MKITHTALEQAGYLGLLKEGIKFEIGENDVLVEEGIIRYCEICEKVWGDDAPTPCNCHGEEGHVYHEGTLVFEAPTCPECGRLVIPTFSTVRLGKRVPMWVALSCCQYHTDGHRNVMRAFSCWRGGVKQWSLGLKKWEDLPRET